MDLTNYLKKRVHIVLDNGFTYIGDVKEIDEDSITILDKTDSLVCLKKISINFIKEVEHG